MTFQSPRIYTYKITFEEVPYYYYGVKKERYFDQYYIGSPKTHKWCWELYTPKKQILQLFDYTDEGWLEAQEIEKQLIKSFYINDKWCLNENCGGKISLKASSKNGLKSKENGTGIFSLTPEQRIGYNRKNGLKVKELGIGIFALTPEERSELGRKNGLKTKENSTGLFSLTPEQKSKLGRRNGLKAKENGTGIFTLSKEQMSENGRKNASQRWECTETGYVSSPPGLSNYQKARGIDTSKRKRIS